MARLLKQYTEPPRPCVYLPDRLASLETRVMLDVTSAELDTLLPRGVRRFGPVYFRPVCPSCQACVSIRVPVATFTPSATQRRTLKRNLARFRVMIGRPTVDDTRLSLYKKWHAFRESERGWGPSPLDHESYFLEFGFPHPSVREVAIYDDEGPAPRLVGIGICDHTQHCWSAVYFFYDPDYARHSLGTFNVLVQIEHARTLGIEHVYLGFWVEGCASMAYKATFRPHELMRRRPEGDELPRWQLDQATPPAPAAPGEPGASDGPGGCDPTQG